MWLQELSWHLPILLVLEKALHTPKLGWYRCGIHLRRKDGDQSESRGGSGSTRSQGEEGGLSMHQGLPIPEHRGPYKGLIPTTCQPWKSQTVLTAPWGATLLRPSGSQGTAHSRGMPM